MKEGIQMARVTQEDIVHINDVYYKCRTYAETARQTGFSASTVKKYVIVGYTPAENVPVTKFDKPLPEFSAERFLCDDWGKFCEYSDEELVKMDEVRRELPI